jgi:transposase
MPEKYQKYPIRLTFQEQEYLTKIVTTDTAPARKIIRANILLASDENRLQGKLSARQISEMYHVHPQTVHDIRKKFCQDGLEKALNRKKRKSQPPFKITGDVEAKVTALACSQAPEGRSQWNLRLLADRTVELEIVDSISHQSIRKILKKRTQASS